LQAAFLTQPLHYWREALDRAGVTFSVVQTIEEIAKDPQLIANENPSLFTKITESFLK
jgi:crotonobetainyl-CoA:carnitine CoA-transferase CaiB-like acyl-CoA transferase